MNEQPPIANLAETVIKKEQLLEIIKDNRNKHNAIFEAPVEGYWVKAEEIIDKKLLDFEQSIDEVKEDFHTAFVRSKEGIKNKNKEIRFGYYSSVKSGSMGTNINNQYYQSVVCSGTSSIGF